ncbi:hypothetical protein K0M31_004124 [Melipona bicolor]|uniref:Uncharacterized protein n=1 Tax=Melipona bicolor TaxID=60889 RepID=A0AA40FYL0_9HYME|nr:hypothetical protein K0M31_004124 [Melipona bicolor]
MKRVTDRRVRGRCDKTVSSKKYQINVTITLKIRPGAKVQIRKLCPAWLKDKVNSNGGNTEERMEEINGRIKKGRLKERRMARSVDHMGRARIWVRRIESKRSRNVSEY